MISGLLFLALLAPAAPPPLHFEHLPLGSVARVLSARFHVPITLLAKATSPVSGDFSGMDLRQALDAAARQTGLEARPEGAGFVLGPKLQTAPATVALPPPPSAPPPALSAAQRREALLRQRAALLDQVRP